LGTPPDDVIHTIASENVRIGKQVILRTHADNSLDLEVRPVAPQAWEATIEG